MKYPIVITKEDIKKMQGRYGKRSKIYFALSIAISCIGIILAFVSLSALLFALILSLYLYQTSNRYLLLSLAGINDMNILAIEEHLDQIHQAMNPERQDEQTSQEQIIKIEASDKDRIIENATTRVRYDA